MDGWMDLMDGPDDCVWVVGKSMRNSNVVDARYKHTGGGGGVQEDDKSKVWATIADHEQ